MKQVQVQMNQVQFRVLSKSTCSILSLSSSLFQQVPVQVRPFQVKVRVLEIQFWSFQLSNQTKKC